MTTEREIREEADEARGAALTSVQSAEEAQRRAHSLRKQADKMPAITLPWLLEKQALMAAEAEIARGYAGRAVVFATRQLNLGLKIDNGWFVDSANQIIASAESIRDETWNDAGAMTVIIRNRYLVAPAGRADRAGGTVI